jgi:hypothetical protein
MNATTVLEARSPRIGQEEGNSSFAGGGGGAMPFRRRESGASYAESMRKQRELEAEMRKLKLENALLQAAVEDRFVLFVFLSCLESSAYHPSSSSLALFPFFLPTLLPFLFFLSCVPSMSPSLSDNELARLRRSERRLTQCIESGEQVVQELSKEREELEDLVRHLDFEKRRSFLDIASSSGGGHGESREGEVSVEDIERRWEEDAWLQSLRAKEEER